MDLGLFMFLNGSHVDRAALDLGNLARMQVQYWYSYSTQEQKLGFTGKQNSPACWSH